MGIGDETSEEITRYAFLLGSALRNEDSGQFFQVYDAIIPKDLTQEKVEHIKETARHISELSEDCFNVLARDVQQFSLALNSSDMTSPRDGLNAGSSTASATSMDSDLRYMELKNSVRPNMNSIKRTSRHFGSQSPELVDDIEEHLGASTPRTYNLYDSSYTSPSSSCKPQPDHDHDGSLDSGLPSSARYLSEDLDDNEEDRAGFFHYQYGGRDSSPPAPSTRQHINSQNTQAYDDAVDCASDSPEDSPRDKPDEIEMQLFRTFEMKEQNRLLKQNNDMVYDERHDVGDDSDGELKAVIVEKSPARATVSIEDEVSDLSDVNVHQRLYGGDNTRRYGSLGTTSSHVRSAPNFHQSVNVYKEKRCYNNKSASTSVDTGVSFPLRSSPPFKYPPDLDLLHASNERLLDRDGSGRRSTSTNTDGTDALSQPSSIDNNRTKKKGKKVRKDESSFDVNGNPIPRKYTGLQGNNVPRHPETSSFGSSIPPFVFGGASTEAAPSSSSSERGKENSRKKKKSKSEVVYAENVPGHIPSEKLDIDDLVKYVNTGKVPQKKKTDTKQKVREPAAAKGKKKKSKKAEGADSPPGEASTINTVTTSGKKQPETPPTPPSSPVFSSVSDAAGATQEVPAASAAKVESDSHSQNSQSSPSIPSKSPPPTPMILTNVSPTAPLSPPCIVNPDYIFTDFMLPSPPKEEEFTLVKNNKKTRKLPSKDIQESTRGVGQRRLPKNGPRPVVNNATGRTSPRSLSPGAFPVLGREGRRNSTGTVPTSTLPLEESDSESVKSLPMVSAPVAPAQASGLPSYANVVAKPRDTGAPQSDVVIVPVAPVVSQNTSVVNAVNVASTSSTSATTTTATSTTTTTSDTKTVTAYDNVGYPPLVANISKDNGTAVTASVQDGAATASNDSSVSSTTTTITTVSNVTTIHISNTTSHQANSHSHTNTTIMTNTTPATDKANSNTSAPSSLKAQSPTVANSSVSSSTSSGNFSNSSAVSSGSSSSLPLPNSTSTSNHKQQQQQQTTTSSTTSAKKTTCQSVIFLDRKFQQPAAPLGISFGFEPELAIIPAPVKLDSRTASLQAAEFQSTDIAKRNDDKIELLPNPTNIQQSDSSAASEAMQDRVGSKAPDNNSKKESKSTAADKPSLDPKHRGLPNGLVVPPDLMPSVPQHKDIVHRFLKPKPREDDVNFKSGKFDREAAVSYILAEWLAVNKQKERDPKNVVTYQPDL